MAAVRGSFDVVHSQGLSSLRADVITAHICNASWFAARRRSADVLKPRERVFAGLVNSLERWYFRRSSRARVIAVSERIRKDLAEAYGRRANVSVVYHGVDADRFSPGSRETFAGQFAAKPDSATTISSHCMSATFERAGARQSRRSRGPRLGSCSSFRARRRRRTKPSPASWESPAGSPSCRRRTESSASTRQPMRSYFRASTTPSAWSCRRRWPRRCRSS